MTRLEANREILQILSELVSRHPDLRFTQIMAMLSYYDNKKFYEESEETLRIIKKHSSEIT